MTFTSHLFLCYFLPLVVALYYVLPKSLRNLLLVLANCVFYASWSPWFVGVLFGVMVGNFVFGLLIEQSRALQRRQKMVTFAVAFNVLTLFVFKYLTLTVNSTQELSATFGGIAWSAPGFIQNIVLPLGLSFYILQGIAYCVDVSRGKTVAAKSLSDFACFTTFFPHLPAGPILKYDQFAPQLKERVYSIKSFALGATRFSYGFAKKILLANPMAEIADSAFGAGVSSLTTFSAWAGVIAFAFQIYLDFSAYADMALGLGKMLGFTLPENFASPYKSASLTEFWQRWFITVTSFFREYVYVPWSQNVSGSARSCGCVLATTFIAGLWYGPSWMFAIWGLFQGVLLLLEYQIAKVTAYKEAPRFVKMLLTFFLLLMGWVIFRAGSLDAALHYLGVMFGAASPRATALILEVQMLRGYHVFHLLLCVFIIWRMANTQSFLQRFVAWKAFLGLILFIVALAMLFTRGAGPFLYFAF